MQEKNLLFLGVPQMERNIPRLRWKQQENIFAELKEKTKGFCRKRSLQTKTDTVGTARTKANRKAARKTVVFEEWPSVCSSTSWKPCISEGAYLLESCFWSCRTRAAVCCCCWVCCKPCLGNCHREKGKSQHRLKIRTESLQPCLVTPGLHLKVSDAFQTHLQVGT